MNVPNILTGIRLLLVPLFLIVFFSGIPNATLIALIIFLAAGLTDILDGHLARKYNMVTKWGSVLDPLADKLMSIAVLLSLTISGTLPIWVLFVLTIKELLLILGGSILFKKGKYLPAQSCGKIATISLYVAIVTVVFINRTAGLILMDVTIVLALYSLYRYFQCFLKLYREK